MPKRVSPITNETRILKRARKQCELAYKRYEEAHEWCEEVKAMIQEKRDRDVHKKKWSRIKASYFGYGSHARADKYFYVEISVIGKENDSEVLEYKRAEWAVHTNYPRNPYSVEDY